MRKYIYTFLFMLFGASLACAQGAAAVANVVSKGTAVVPLARTGLGLGRVPTGMYAVESARYAELWNAHNVALAASKAELTKPISLDPATPTKLRVTLGERPTITRINEMTRRQMAVNQNLKEGDELLYNWGLLQDQANVLGYKSTPILEDEGGLISLQLNNRTVVVKINASEWAGDLPVVSSNELMANAMSVNVTERTLTNEILKPLLQDSPETLAAFHYLRQNYRTAFEEFRAAGKEYSTYMSANTGTYQRAKNWLVGESEAGQQIKQNYLNASANLALHMSKLLTFMASHSTQAFEQSLKTYKELMKIKNVNQNVPTTFQDFCSPRISI